MNQYSIPIDPIFLQILLKLVHSLALTAAVFGSIRLVHKMLDKFGGTSHRELGDGSSKQTSLPAHTPSRPAGYLVLPEDRKNQRPDLALMVLQFVEKWGSTLSFVFYLTFKTIVNIKKWMS
jgi:hypothetical protein